MSYLSAQQAFTEGGVLSYPTEAVFGLGCDPDNINAVNQLLALKQRPVSKGLILLAGEFEQLSPYLDLSNVTREQLTQILARWPDGITQVLPAAKTIPSYLTGNFTTIAVRLTTQSDVVSLCAETGKPIVSTSANFSGQPPAKTWQEVEHSLGDHLDYIIKGHTLKFEKPSTIIDGLSGNVFR